MDRGGGGGLRTRSAALFPFAAAADGGRAADNARGPARHPTPAAPHAHPTMEVSTPKVTVTAALADTLCTAISDARKGVNNALNLTKTKVMAKDDAETAFRKRYRGVIKELEDILADDDPKRYDFGLSRPADPATSGQPAIVHATALGGARVLVQTDGARRANSVKEYLVSLGVSNARVDTVSYGKERPICTESAESCWSQNRRGVTVVMNGANS